ncbi:MAG: LexA family protein [Thermoguttaceae bacterium]
MSFIERKGLCFPLFETKVQAGYPSQADEAKVQRLDISALLVPRPASTSLVRVTGESMVGAGIFAEDILIVDRSIEAKSGDIVVVTVENDFTVRRLIVKEKKYSLKAENSKFPLIKLADSSDLKVWGVVRHVIHRV